MSDMYDHPNTPLILMMGAHRQEFEIQEADVVLPSFNYMDTEIVGADQGPVEKFSDINRQTVEIERLGMKVTTNSVVITKDESNLIGISIGGGAPMCPCLYIVQVFDGTPASREGSLQSGDELLAVNVGWEEVLDITLTTDNNSDVRITSLVDSTKQSVHHQNKQKNK